MKEKKYNKCLKELKKPKESRNLEDILDYIKTLEPLMSLIQERNEYSEDIINKIIKIMNLQSNKTNDLIIQYGERGNNFYIILQGTIGIFVPKYTEYYMSEEEFILHLLKLRIYNQNELIIQCLRKNSLIFSIPNERFDDFLFDLKNKKIFIEKKRLISKAEEVYDYLNSEEYINNKNSIKNISPEGYISQFDVDDDIKKYTEELNDLSELKIEYDDDKRLTKIPNYEMVSQFEAGYTFGELALENINKKRMATIITLTDCDFAVIDKLEYNELIKESVSKSKNKFFDVIYSYKIFDYISYETFDKKYFNHFRYLKVKNNSFLLKEGEICDNLYFILSGEYEVFVDKNIQEVNQMILKLIDITDYFKKIIIQKYKSINYKTSKIEKRKENLKIKQNLNLFFSKFENEIKLEEIAYIIKNTDIINKKNYIGYNFNKVISEKREIKLGIYKSRQILGLSDMINRATDNTSYFNCKCVSFWGELYHIEYNKFQTIYNTEENVKLHTSELIYQNLYYIIGRLLSHKKYIYEIANKKENEFLNLLFYFHNDNNNKTTDNNSKNKIEKVKTPRKENNISGYKLRTKFLMNHHNKINMKNFKFAQNDNPSYEINSNFLNRINSLSSIKNVNLNIFNHMNIIKMDNTLSEKKEKEKEKEKEYNDNLDKSNNESNTPSNNRSKIESYTLSKQNKIILSKTLYSKSHKNLKSNNRIISRNLLNKKYLSIKTKSEDNKLQKIENEFKFPVLLINNREVKINEKIRDNLNHKKNYKNLIKSIIDSKNQKLIDIIKSKEYKNIALFGDYSETIEKKNKYKNQFRKKRNILIVRNIMKKMSNKNINIIHKFKNKRNFCLTSHNKDTNKTKFLTYNFSDLDRENKKDNIKIEGIIKLIKFGSLKENKLNAGTKKPYKNDDNIPKSLSPRYTNKFNSEYFSSPPIRSRKFLKKKISSHIYKNIFTKKDTIN